MHPTVVELLDAIEVPVEEWNALREACAQAPARPTSRNAMAWLMLDHVATRDPALADETRRHLDAIGGRFAEVAFDVPAAMMSWMVTRLGDDAGAPLLTRTNRLLARGMSEQRDAPLMQTFLRACDGDWDAFIGDYDTLRRVFASGSGGTRIERPSPRSFVFHDEGAHVPALCYVLQGTFEGLLGAFGRSGTSQLERDGERVTLTLQW